MRIGEATGLLDTPWLSMSFLMKRLRIV